MWAGIITALLPWALKLLGYFVDNYTDKVAAKRAYLQFLTQIEDQLGDSARLRRSVQDQRARIRDKLKGG